MLCLGIESTAHTFSCAVLEKTRGKTKIKSDIRKIYRPAEGEGIHPREASRHHIENSSQVLSQCLSEAKISVNDLDIISSFFLLRRNIRFFIDLKCIRAWNIINKARF